MRNVIVAVVISLALLVTLNTNAFAIVFTNTVNPDVFLSGTGTYSWSHLTPADFEVPFDTVNSATLTIDTFLLTATMTRYRHRAYFRERLITAHGYSAGLKQAWI